MLRSATVHYERRRCRCSTWCANVPARPDGRLWAAAVGRYDDDGSMVDSKVWANEVGMWDSEDYLPGINNPGRFTFTPREWDSLEKA
jgi:hypothetical protein